MKQEIAQLGASVLRRKAEKITDFNAPALMQLIEDMLCTLDSSDGVGLAAPQISQSFCVLVIASKPTTRYPDAPEMKPIVMINPVFKALSKRQGKDWEGCLSIPSIRALVSRYQNISVDYHNVNGNMQQLELDGFVARVFQHEYDHLQGLVYLDCVEDNKDIISETEFFKLIAA
ncbi:MAG: peptide deformylase [Methylococcaceae bacterium]|nr:peptide deformylase [Methylococcaceae bacterium]